MAICSVAVLALGACNDSTALQSDGQVDDTQPDAQVGDADVQDARAEDARIDDAEIEDAASPSMCAWGIDEMLAEVGVNDFAGADCGSFGFDQFQEISDALDCLLSAPENGATFNVNRCIDCTITSVYVRTSTGSLFELQMESDVFGGDDQQEATAF